MNACARCLRELQWSNQEVKLHMEPLLVKPKDMLRRPLQLEDPCSGWPPCKIPIPAGNFHMAMELLASK